MKKITSYNQQGGITAGSIYLSHRGMTPKKKKILKRIITVIIIIAALVAILEYMGINPFNKKDKEASVNVTSYDQQGGITANEVTINPTIGLPPPKFEYQVLSLNQKQGSDYETNVVIKIISQSLINHWQILVRASSVKSVGVGAYPSTNALTLFNVREFNGEGLAGISFDRPYGAYLLKITTKEEENNIISSINISYEQ